MKVNFRPSSHSEDYTILGVFPDKKIARLAYNAVRRLLRDIRNGKTDFPRDWSLDEATVRLRGNRVLFSVYTAGYIETIRALLEKYEPEILEEYTNYQELEIRLTLPSQVSIKTAPLILPKEQLALFRQLLKICKVTTKREKKQTIFIFRYFGEEIYTSEGVITIGSEEYPVDQWDNWEIYLL
ncbi:MAG: hypothetical protein ACTSV6_07235 [Candidatus Heimdallarchaeota archaeon]